MLLRDALVGGTPRRQPHRRTGMRGLAREAGPALTQVPIWKSLPAGRTGSSAAQDTTGRKIGHRRRQSGLAVVTSDLSQWPARIRDGERGVMGAPRSRQFTVNWVTGS